MNGWKYQSRLDRQRAARRAWIKGAILDVATGVLMLIACYEIAAVIYGLT